VKNRATISIEFDFKGERHSPSAEFDLDEIMQKSGTIPDLYSILASLNNIGHYSYEYEMMQSEEMQFSNLTGFAAEYLNDGVFDKEGFVQRWFQEQQLTTLQQIALQHMEIDDLTQHPKLYAALQAAYQQGKSGSQVA